MSGGAADHLPGCALALAGWRASLCRAAGAGDAASHPSTASGQSKARQTEGEHGGASGAAKQLPRPLSMREEATAENAECNSQYIRKSSVGFRGQVRLVSARYWCCL